MRGLLLAVSLCGLSLGQLGCLDESEGRRVTPALGEADGGREAVVVCDPLAAAPKPIELEHVVAVGRAPDGTLYVVSEQGARANKEQVFVASGEVLQRKRTLGSSSSGGARGDDDRTLSYEDGPTPNRLVLKQRSGVVVGMALVHDRDRTFFDALPGGALQLALVEPRAIANLALQNLPGDVVLEHSAHVADGSQVLVTRPLDDWAYEDFRVYYGRDGAFVERAGVMVSRGSSTWVTFQVDGAEVTAVFVNAVLAPNQPSTLRTPNGELALTLDGVAAGLPAGATFRCLH